MAVRAFPPNLQPAPTRHRPRKTAATADRARARFCALTCLFAGHPQADDVAVAMQQASTDWRFWFGVIAVVSVITAVVGHQPTEQVYSV
eukprot:1796174-Prymnesium_polylepis.1